MNNYKIADLIISVSGIGDYTKSIMSDYLYFGDTPASFSVHITDDMIKYEEEHSPENFPKNSYESTAVLRSICMEILNKYDGFFFHCSSLAFDNKGFLFTAPSGTGKSTHAKLWQKHFGNKVTMINDDKPIIRRENGKFYIYGTPWQGKSNIGNNIKVPVHAVCVLNQGQNNTISKLSYFEALTIFMDQTERPNDKKSMENLVDLFDDFINQIPVYKMSCNISDEAVTTAFNAMY